MLKELYKILEKPASSQYGELIQKLLLINILVNILVVSASIFFDFSDTIQTMITYIEYGTVVLFVMELIFRYVSIGYDKRYSGLKGRVKFTFTPFIIIDIITLLPYMLIGVDADILLLRLLRFVRILKLIRLKNIMKKFISISAFATSSITTQVIVLFILSVCFITFFSFIYTSDKMSLMIFLDPSAISKTITNYEMAFGVVELTISLFIGGALISIITELLANITSKIKDGYHPYKNKGHILIINHNKELEFILEEINQYYIKIEQMQDIVIFLPFVDDIDGFRQNLTKYSNLEIFITSGDELNWNSYLRVNINFVQKVLILRELNQDINYLNVKITRYILMQNEFNNSSLEFIIEIDDEDILRPVYSELFRGKQNKYLTIEHNNIIERILSRSIVEPDYFKIYSELMSFYGYEFYRLNASEVIKEDISFKELCIKFSQGVLVGIRKNDELYLNPSREMVVTPRDKLVTILTNKVSFQIDNNLQKSYKIMSLKKPPLRIDNKIAIVGDYENISKENLSSFLTNDSIANIDMLVKKDNDYFNNTLWDNIILENYDFIILNIEDDYELMLTLYLRDIYKENSKFLSSIINIITHPTNARLLEDKTKNSNIILSNKLVGQYIAQVIFNHGISDIFNEITQLIGNGFHILNKTEYKELYDLDVETMKMILIQNNMIYIGVIEENKFIVNCNTINKNTKIVVLASGEF